MKWVSDKEDIQNVPLVLLDYGKNHNHDYFGQYWNHDYLTGLLVGDMIKILMSVKFHNYPFYSKN